jgi:hypothetical protein
VIARLIAKAMTRSGTMTGALRVADLDVCEDRAHRRPHRQRLAHVVLDDLLDRRLAAGHAQHDQAIRREPDDVLPVSSATAIAPGRMASRNRS